MKSRITKTVALAALMAGASGVANATEGWYGRADVGYSADGTLDLEPAFAGQDSFDLDNGFSEHLGIGYAMMNGFRLEGEIGHRFNDLRSDNSFLEDGNARAWSAMANVFYDFNHDGAAQPYIGLGVGAARVDASLADHDSLTYINDDDTGIAYQALAGVAIGLTEQLDLDIGYRYFTVPELEFDGSEQTEPLTFDGEYTHQAVTVGLRYQFAAAEPPPPPPPPPAPPPPPPPPPPVATCPTSEFVVYFEWDRSNLNQAALETIDAAVNRARQCNVGGVVVVGHTDTSGSPQYNIGLSERRASVVRDALVARGIAAGSIRSEARGETDLARATRDGVREPLNRRTAVTISFR